MVAKDAGWAMLAAVGFFMLCAFSIWGEMGGEGLFKQRQGLRHSGSQTQATVSGAPRSPGRP